MRTAEAEGWLRNELSTTYEAGEAANIADWVMEHLTSRSKMERAAKKDEPLIVQQLHRLTEIHHRLMHGEPVQYVLKEVHFYRMKLFIDRSVLIPRPETEELVDWVIKEVQASGKDVLERKGSKADETTLLKILDVGTGSGCIALALKKEMPKAEIWACDKSDAALNIARRNGSELDIRVDFVGLDFLDETQRTQLPTVDIIVSNPPYIPLKEKEHMKAHVIEHEPHAALFVTDDDPLVFYTALAHFGKDRLYPNGSIYAEIHEEAGKKIAELFQTEGYSVTIKKDMQGKERMVKAMLRREL